MTSRPSIDTLRCPVCAAWITSKRGRLKLDAHIRDEHPEAHARRRAARAELLGIVNEVSDDGND